MVVPKYSLLLLLPLLLLLGCGKSNAPKTLSITLTTSDGRRAVVIPPGGKSFFAYLEASHDWTLQVCGEGASISSTQGGAGEQPIAIRIGSNTEGERRIVLLAQLKDAPLRDSVIILQQGSGSSGGELGEEQIHGDPTLLELPRLSGRKTDYFVTHFVEAGRRVNFSLEYDTEAFHSRWVAFSFDNHTKQRKVGRSPDDSWRWDPKIPAQYAVERYDYARGLQRGHLVASADRLFSAEANLQTFYYSNISPQRGALNAGIWLQMEKLVQDWGRSLAQEETLYVAKGGTIRPDQIESIRSNNKIVVPKYYWMAIVKHVAPDGWYGVGLLCEHVKPAEVPGGLLRQAMSLDELEQFIGLDLFHNLPDEIERRVQQQKPQQQIALWPGL